MTIMTPLDEHAEHALLDRFRYADRTDDGYGPDRPRLGDTGWFIRPAGLFFEEINLPFEIAREPKTGLPALKLGTDPRPMPDRVRPQVIGPSDWESLLGASLDGVDLVLTGRPPRHAVTTDTGLIELDPPYEGSSLLRVDGMLLLDAYTGRVVGQVAFGDVVGALSDLGYALSGWTGEDGEE